MVSFHNPEGLLRFSKDSFLLILNSLIKQNVTNDSGILLSGGIDSAVLSILAAKYYPDIPCFVVGHDIMHSDVQAAKQLAEEKGLNLKVRIFNTEEIIVLKQELKECMNLAPLYEGDECVFGALKFAARDVIKIIATDGIDELMGGYWGHRDRKRFPDIKDAFKHYWDKLEGEHLLPMCRSAEFFELDIIFIYLLPEIVEHLSIIPLEDRIKGGVGKAIWREIAEMVGVPSWVIERKKEGFVNAFK